VHGKGSLLHKMSGDDWQKFANLRALFGYMYAQAAKKLLFMGGEIGQWREWVHDDSVDWNLLQYAPHQGLQQWVADLNRLYRTEPALHELDFESRGFEWIDCQDVDAGVISLLRHARSPQESIAVVCNFTPVPRLEYRIGVPRGGYWKELLNSDAPVYGGSGSGNLGGVTAETTPTHGRSHCLTLTLPPLAVLFLKPLS
jgi:1,4-alpha-glucan branching enzyme